ncbi:hypothetical protein MKX03_011808, partial [Papaver bracteatum]
MLCNEFDFEFILESVRKTIMVFFFRCFRVKDVNQNHHIISDSSNKKNPLVSRNLLAALLLSESQEFIVDCDHHELLWYVFLFQYLVYYLLSFLHNNFLLGGDQNSWSLLRILWLVHFELCFIFQVPETFKISFL